jgi:trehalose-6-phosphate synthase
MSLEERRERHAAMIDILSRNSIAVWRRRFVAALTDAGEALDSTVRNAVARQARP